MIISLKKCPKIKKEIIRMKDSDDRCGEHVADLERHKGYKNPQSGTRLYDKIPGFALHCQGQQPTKLRGSVSVLKS